MVPVEALQTEEASPVDTELDPSNVSLRTPANALGVTLAEHVATGAAEALALGYGSERRLTAIAIEATRNVVEHAYVDRDVGGIELSIGVLRGGEHEPASVTPGRGEILIRVSDTGGGCPLTPTSTEPAGLGLAMMSELSEALTIESHKDRGTEIGATISFSRGDSPMSPTAASSRPDDRQVTGETEMVFGDPAFLVPIVPRVLSAHATHPDITLDALQSVVAQGTSLAKRLAEEEAPPPISVAPGSNADALSVHIGPVQPDRGRALADDLRRKFDDPLTVLLGPEPNGGVRIQVRIPLQ